MVGRAEAPGAEGFHAGQFNCPVMASSLRRVYNGHGSLRRCNELGRWVCGMGLPSAGGWVAPRAPSTLWATMRTWGCQVCLFWGQ